MRNTLLDCLRWRKKHEKTKIEWMELFEENKKKALELKSQIDQTYKEISFHFGYQKLPIRSLSIFIKYNFCEVSRIR